MSTEPQAEAAELLGVDAKFLTPFDTTDPFNNDTRLEGFLCQRPDHRYGALALLRVGERPAPQAIFATPKLHYPFGRDGRFHFPPIRKAVLYEKLDGTNVLSYWYRDADGQQHLTYKLRLSAAVRNSRFGPFLDYWRELLERYPNIPKLAAANRCHVSFEMYGSRNGHLIAYDVALEPAVLFGIRPADATVVPPFELELLDVPAAVLIGELTGQEDPVTRYGDLRAAMEKRNRPVENEQLAGTEGAVWYVVEPSGRVTMWKCKPESVEQIHWAMGINKAAVIATCWNCLETNDDLTWDALVPMLLEDYSQEEIDRYRAIVLECIDNVKRDFAYKERVWAEYVKTGISIRENKGGAMRALAQVFSKQEMKKVYAIIEGREGK